MADTRFPTDTPLKTPHDDDSVLLADSEDDFESKQTTVLALADAIDVSSKADKTNVLELDNTTSFTPNADYEPATKKYVDDNNASDPSLRIDIDINAGDIITNATQIGLNTIDIDTNTTNTNLNVAHKNNLVDPHEGAVLIDMEMKTFMETIVTPSSSSGVLLLDYAAANTFNVTLTENITTIDVDNAPTSGKAGSLTLTLTQDATTPRTVDFSNILWSDGIEPVMTTELGGVDFYLLTTYDGGTTWYGFTIGQLLGGEPTP